MSTYRVTATVELEISTDHEWTEPQTQTAMAALVKASLSRWGERTGGWALTLRDDPIVSIDEPWCAAIARRNSVDGKLYACQMAKADVVHLPVGECGRNPCDRPEEHHEYLSPGWDAPVEAAVPA